MVHAFILILILTSLDDDYDFLNKNNDDNVGGGVPGDDDVCRSLLGLHRGLPLLVPRRVHA
jgi:hypothetical protein